MSREAYLSQMRPGEKGMIKRIDATGLLRRKLLDMGVIPRSEVEVVKLAPLGDPIDVKIKGYHLSLRKEEAKNILVERQES